MNDDDAFLGGVSAWSDLDDDILDSANPDWEGAACP